MRLTSKQRGYGGNWRHISLALRRAHPYCTLCGSSTDLTVDHLDQRDNPTAPRSTASDRLRVLCRPCNSRRQAQYNAQRGIGGRRRRRTPRTEPRHEWGTLAE